MATQEFEGAGGVVFMIDHPLFLMWSEEVGGKLKARYTIRGALDGSIIRVVTHKAPLDISYVANFPDEEPGAQLIESLYHLLSK